MIQREWGQRRPRLCWNVSRALRLNLLPVRALVLPPARASLPIRVVDLYLFPVRVPASAHLALLRAQSQGVCTRLIFGSVAEFARQATQNNAVVSATAQGARSSREARAQILRPC